MADAIDLLNAVGPSSPALESIAIARCIRTFQDTFRGCIENHSPENDALKQAGEAFRAVLPPLNSRENCRDFIACVAQGILLGAIEDKNAGRLLYAAQVATGAATAEEKSRERAGYAIYADLSETDMQHAQKFMPKRRNN